MKISVKTAGILGNYLPAGGPRNSAELEVDASTTPLDVIRFLKMPLDDSYLVIINGEIVPPGKRDDRVLRENDQLSIMPALRGG